MAEGLVSSVLLQLANTTVENTKQEVKLVTGVENEIERLKGNFEAIQAVLEDAEEKQIVDKNVSRWLHKLKDVSYDMEDVLDEWDTAILKVRLQTNHGVESASLPKKMVCPFISCFSFGHRVVKRHDIGIKIRGINEKLDEIAREKDRYQLTKREIRNLPRRLESTSIIDESKLLGRDEIRKEIVGKLLDGTSDQGSGISTISLIGMGGIGKTALAKMVFNDVEVQRHFGKTVWICVSDVFDISKIARDILEGLDHPASTSFQNTVSVSLNGLLTKIHETVTKTKILIVLDDVWEDHFERWEELKSTLRNCKAGSRILVTTRKDSVVKVMESSHVLPLEQLPDEICLAILERVAFMGRDSSDHEELEDIGKEIAQKCKGLPLAATTLGSLLREKESKAEWESILNSEIWRLDIAHEHIFKPLLLSYYDLPSKIRRCLLYCAIFPKDYVMSPSELILHWEVQGYLNFDEDSEIEVNGKGYFNYLASRSFFQDFQKDRHGVIYNCKMHDVIHDFIQFLTKEEIVAKDFKSTERWSFDLSSRGARHLRITIGEGKRFPASITGVGRMRSLIVIGQKCNVSSEVLRGLFSEAKCLRMLELGLINRDWAASVNKIPEDIDKLVHLRYLNLCYSYGLRKLPKEICELHNLQYLNLQFCNSLEELPDKMEKLINLKYLYTFGCNGLTYYPKGIGKLTSLRRLDRIIAKIDCNDNKVFSLGDLENLDLLSGRIQLHIKVNSLGDCWEEEAQRAKLQNKMHLTKLEMTLYLDSRYVEQEIQDRVIQALNPPPNLRFQVAMVVD